MNVCVLMAFVSTSVFALGNESKVNLQQNDDKTTNRQPKIFHLYSKNSNCFSKVSTLESEIENLEAKFKTLGQAFGQISSAIESLREAVPKIVKERTDMKFESDNKGTIMNENMNANEDENYDYNHDDDTNTVDNHNEFDHYFNLEAAFGKVKHGRR